ncbi:MAG: DUF1552 domain-containing protein [Archangium sp.]|nr:DUF1552 domain-containing protein [Archangium sp.]
MRASRRALLAGGMASALFPWLSWAQVNAPRKKLLLFYTPHGTIWPNWRPTPDGMGGFTLSPILAPLAAHQNRVVLMDGISLPYGTSYYIPHTYTMPALWTGSPIDTASTLFTRTDHMQSFGWGTGVSVDQFIASQLPAGETPYRSIELGTFCGGLHPATRMIYSAPGMVKSPVDVPLTAFNQFFSAPNPDLDAAAKALARRRSVLDTVLDDMNARKAVLTTNDRARLDAHATAVRALETRLQAMTPSCPQPTAPPAGTDPQLTMDRQMDLAAAALGCGLTRVLSLQMRIADNDNSLYPWLGLNTGGHHTFSHDSSTASQATLSQVYTWYSARFAKLLDVLAATPDLAGGSVLDHTLVIWGSELGIGWTHDISNVPFVLAGGPGVVRGNQYLQVTNKTNHRVLVTALHWMGFTPMQSYGALDPGSGPLTGVLA